MTEFETEPAPALRQNKRAVVDLVLAACIGLLAMGFWFWDSRPMPDAMRAQTVPAHIAFSAAMFNDAGMQMYHAANYVGAEAQFRQAISAEPSSALGYCNLGATLMQEHRYDDAVAVLQHSVALDPGFALARNNLAWALDEQKKHQK